MHLTKTKRSFVPFLMTNHLIMNAATWSEIVEENLYFTTPAKQLHFGAVNGSSAVGQTLLDQGSEDFWIGDWSHVANAWQDLERVGSES